jgi:hypothetical protein
LAIDGGGAQRPRGLNSAQGGCGAGPLGRPSHWLLGPEPTRAQGWGRGPIFIAGQNRHTVNSKGFHLSFEFQKLFYLVFLVYLLFFI